MAVAYVIYRNYNSDDSTFNGPRMGPLPQITNVGTVDWSRPDYDFLGWNTSSYASGTMYQPGDTPSDGDVFFAIWKNAVVTPYVIISYNGNTIASLSNSGTEVLETNGKLCEDDITIDYTKPSPYLQFKVVNPSTSYQTIYPDNGYDGLSHVSVQGISPIKSAQTYTPTTTDQTIASGRWLIGTQTIKGDANLVAGNIKSGVSIFGVSGTYSAVNDLPSFIEKGINIFSNSVISKIRSYAFMETNIFRIDCPSVTEIGTSAFYYCSKLVTISFPACISIASSVFNQCSSLATAIFPECTSVGSLAFFSCKKLSQISFPKLTTVSQSCFGNCPSLATAIFPECLTVGYSAFVSCVALSQISFPKCKSIFSNAFAKCYSITSVNFPECTTLGGNTFQNDYNLVDVSFPKLQSITAYYTFDKCSNISVLSFPALSRTIQRGTFTNCYRLLSLYLMSTSVVYMADSSAFTSSPIGGYTNYTNGVYGSIYVPSSLLSSYKTATNWTYFSSRIVGI